ncbi:hypothetical protein ACHAPX_008614 [Trichoderma viride]
MIQALKEFGGRGTVSTLSSKPKIVTLGGDDSLSLPALRALKETYGRLVRVLRFDDDDAWNWIRFSRDDVDDIGTTGTIEGIMKTLGARARVLGEEGEGG